MRGDGATETLHSDVVIVGAGPAGMAAAASAAEAGASVVVLESDNCIGGNAIRSNGYLAFVGDDDSMEAFVADAYAAYRSAADRYGLVWDEAAVRKFAVHSAKTYRILTGRRVRFSRIVSRPEHSVDRIHAVVDAAMFGVRADRLIVEDGRVAGVNGHRMDADGSNAATPLVVRAASAVVLATGGFQAGYRLREHYEPIAEAHLPYYGTPNCRGDGHVMGAAVGGDLVNMTYLPSTVLAPSTVAENAIAINDAAMRFHDETGSFAQRVAALHAEGHAWYVLDEAAAYSQSRLIDQMPLPHVHAGSVAELACAIGVPADQLAATVDRWNNFLASPAGADPQFGRTALPEGRRPIGTALVAVPMVEGVNFSCGGFRTTGRMQVINVFGEAIPGLYAAGDTTAGLNAAAGMMGLHISGAFTQGRIAGRAAAASAPDTADYGSVLEGGEGGGVASL